MAKISSHTLAGWPVKTLRRLAGIPATRGNRVSSCVGATLRGQRHPAAPPGAGGRRNVGWQQQFVAAVRQCAGRAG